LTANAFTRTGYTFQGWATSANGAKVYNDKQSVSNLTETSGAVVNLYAVWKAGEDTTTESMIMPGYAASNKSPSTYQKAVTYADVEEIEEDYYNTISKNKTKTVYWNAAKRGVGVMLTAPFQSTVTTSGCDAARKDTYMEINKEDTHAARLDKHGRDETAIKDGKKVYGCSSNLFERDAQCEGFANYMAYVVFRVKDKSAFTLCQGGGANSLKNKANDEIKPGSVVRTAGGHSYFIYKVNETYAYYIECNTDPAQDCKIQYDQKIKIDKLKTNIIKGDKIYISPAVKVEGDYTISFNANKPTDTAKITGTMQPQSAKMGVAVTLPANAFAVEGYLFGGWNTKADGSGTVYADNQSVTNLTTTSGSTVTLYAQWKAADKTYTIQYNGNGGRGTMPVTNLAVGVAGNLSRNAYRKDAHVFTGWNTAADGTGTAYADQQSVLNVTTEDKKVVTLYAQWREMTEAEYLKTCTKYASHMKLTVTNASGSIMAKPVNQGTVARNLVAGETLASTALYKNASGEYWYQVQADRDGKTGFVYAGNVRNDGIANKTVRFNVSLEKTNILMGKKCDIKGSVSAQHNILYELTGKLNDKDPNTAEQTATTKSGFSSLIGTAINNNLAFGKLNRGDGTLVLTAKLRSAYSSGKDLKWEEYTSPKYTLKFTVLGTNPVTYDKNTTDEVENMPAQQQKTDKTDLTLAKEIPVRAGYTFQGWATSADAQEVAYAPGALYQKDEALTLYALWAKNDEVVTYTVYYSSDKSSYGLPDSQTKTQGVPLTLSDMVPGSQFYTFTGWETEVNGERLVFQPGDTFNLDSNVTLTATWKVTSYLHDAVSGKSWELGEAFRELTEPVDTTDMYHVTIGFSLSDKILAEFSSAEAWYQLHTPNVLGSWDFATLELRDGKLDFYVTPGTWITLLGDVNCAYTFEQSEDIVLNVQMLTFHGNGGLLDENDPLTDMCYSQYAVGYPQSGSPAPEFYRSGYTLLGWSNDPAAAQPLYALDMTWSQLDPGHADLYAIWQQNEVTE